jgi:hypothetical protein
MSASHSLPTQKATFECDFVQCSQPPLLSAMVIAVSGLREKQHSSGSCAAAACHKHSEPRSSSGSTTMAGAAGHDRAPTSADEPRNSGVGGAGGANRRATTRCDIDYALLRRALPALVRTWEHWNCGWPKVVRVAAARRAAGCANPRVSASQQVAELNVAGGVSGGHQQRTAGGSSDCAASIFGRVHHLSRYWADWCAPRPESYRWCGWQTIVE